jgi:hypothetical protein
VLGRSLADHASELRDPLGERNRIVCELVRAGELDERRNGVAVLRLDGARGERRAERRWDELLERVVVRLRRVCVRVAEGGLAAQEPRAVARVADRAGGQGLRGARAHEHLARLREILEGERVRRGRPEDDELAMLRTDEEEVGFGRVDADRHA